MSAATPTEKILVDPSILGGEAAGAPAPFTLWTPQDFLDWEPPAGAGVLLNDQGAPLFEKGNVVGILGPPGVGKTRLALNLAVACLTGRTWCGLATGHPGGTVVFLSNENGRRRWRYDLWKILGSLDEGARTIVSAGLLIQCPAGPEDLDLHFVPNAKKWEATLRAARPAMLVIDPFEAACGGDANDSVAVRETISGIRAALTAAAGEESLVVFVHHSRTGAGNFRQAVGWDASNFVKGSKTAISMWRAAVNMAPADPENPGAKVLVSSGKNNDCAPFEPRAVDLDPETMTYSVDTAFDLQGWKDDVEGKRGGKQCTIRDVVEAVRGGLHSAGDIKAHLAGQLAVSERTVGRALTDALRRGYLISPLRGKYTLPAKGPAG